MKLFVFLVIMCGCIRYDAYNWICDCPYETEYAIDRFVLYAPDDLKYKKLTIKLVDNINREDGAVGLTVYNKKTIYLDTTSRAWKVNKEALIWHELGHYILGRGDINSSDTVVNGIRMKKSVMHFKAVDRFSNMAPIEEYFLKELFN